METRSIELMCSVKAKPTESIVELDKFFKEINAVPVFEKGQVLYFNIGGE
jgi:hypothetical protein